MAHFMFARALAYGILDDEINNEARISRRAIRDMTDPFSIADTEFIANFRLSKVACHALIADLTPHFDAGRYSSRIPIHLRVLSALHFFAMGSYQRSSGSCPWVCLSQPMVSRAITEVSRLIIRHCLNKWIRLPRNNEEKRSASQRFRMKFRMPDIIGVVDGTHVAIVTPAENEHVYVNRKGYHSINVQIVCNEELKIISIVARYPGSSHDAFIWRNSRVGMTMKANYDNGDETYKIMGDSGYPCLPWTIIPLNNPQTPEEARFNRRLKTSRSVVERCIGHLKGRFRCLLKHRVLHYTPGKAAKIIMACAVLHNIAVHYRVNDPEPMWDDIDLEQQDVLVPQDAAYDGQYRELGKRSRQLYINRYF